MVQDASNRGEGGGSRLTRAMAEIALRVLPAGSWLESPVISFDEEHDRRGREAPMFELQGRTGNRAARPVHAPVVGAAAAIGARRARARAARARRALRARA